MGYSAKIKIDGKRPKKDGTCMLFLQVIINRKKAKIDLGISWPANKFSEGVCRKRMRNDPDINEYNVIIGNAQTKANNIHKYFLLRDFYLTLEAFMREYRSNLNKSDFIQYFSMKSYERWNKNVISQSTYEKEKGTLKRIKQYAYSIDPENRGRRIPEDDIDLKGVIFPFHEFTIQFGHDFDRFLKKMGNEHNTRWVRHKHITTYLNIASKIDNIPFNDPYGTFKNTLVDGKWKPLDLDEMRMLLKQYLEWRNKPLPLLKRKNGINQVDTRPGLTAAEVIVLRRFLFSCNCALRISDLQQLNRSMFCNGEMSITPNKTERYGTKIDSVPLNDIARLMLDDEIADCPGEKVFYRYTDQSSNRLLKRVAAKCNLQANLHHHVARYTFASLMDQAGANHTGLMKYMGLRKRETLEKYVKTNKKVIASDIERMNEMIKS